jgi:hypothetical protein
MRFIEAAWRSIRALEISEADTSNTCFNCHTKDRKARKTQGLFQCVNCSIRANADYNGAMNILQRRFGILSTLGRFLTYPKPWVIIDKNKMITNHRNVMVEKNEKKWGGLVYTTSITVTVTLRCSAWGRQCAATTGSLTGACCWIGLTTVDARIGASARIGLGQCDVSAYSRYTYYQYGCKCCNCYHCSRRSMIHYVCHSS